MSEQQIYNLFFSQNNYKLLLSVVFDHLVNEYDYAIKEDEEELCIQVMNHIYKNSAPKKITTSVRDYIKGLNRSTIDRLIEIIIEKLHKDMLPNIDNQLQQVDIINEPRANISQQQEIDNRNIQIQPRQNGLYSTNIIDDTSQKFKSTSFPGSNRDVIGNFEKINKDRNIDYSQREVPKGRPAFESKYRQNNKNVANDFKKAMVDRGYQTNDATNSILDAKKDLEIRMDKEDAEKQNISKLPGIDPDKQFSEVPNNKQKAMLGEPLIPTNMSMLIKQPEIFKKYLEKSSQKLTKTYHIVIDSRDRNHDVFQTTNEYEVDLNTVYKDIVSIELLSAEIPHSGYIINSSNNELHFIETNAQVSGNTYYTATISQGNYTADELATAIVTQMNLAGQSTYTVNIDTTSRKFKISSNTTGGDNIFQLRFRGKTEKYDQDVNRYRYIDRSIGQVIGFQRTDLTGLNNYTGQNQYNLNGENYVLLHIDNLDNMEGRGIGISNSFAKITLTSNLNETRFYSMNEYLTKKIFNPPLNRLSQLFIKFKKYDGSLYDFGGIEHSLFFKVTTLIQSQGFML